ncbi:MAG: glutathione synthase [Gammaproteobacteria bacterium]|jgi:glutathione synthase
MTPTLGVVMDPIATINIKKDSTFAMLLEAQARGWPLRYMEQSDLWLENGQVHASMRALRVADDPQGWFELGSPEVAPLDSLDVVLMRKDPPLDMEYLYSLYLLELAEAQGTRVINAPGGIRAVNEKLYTAWFPDLAPPSLVTRDMPRLRAFLETQGEAVVKPLDGMGGAEVFRLRRQDPNLNVILESVTHHGRRTVMCQRFLPEYTQGDKRILLVDGEPVPYALARIPAEGEGRANLAAGGHGVGVELTARDREIAERIGPVMCRMGLLFVGLDVIGDYLTEINVTSPTCIRELDAIYGINISAQLMDAILARLKA